MASVLPTIGIGIIYTLASICSNSFSSKLMVSVGHERHERHEGSDLRLGKLHRARGEWTECMYVCLSQKL